MPALSESDIADLLVPYLPDAPAPLLSQLSIYLDLLLKWNARTNLTAIRDPEEIVRRHFGESLFAARHLHPDTPTLLDFGSGAGFPGVPIALLRTDIHVTLAESQRKKAMFLQEALRTLRLRASVHAARAETLPEAGFDAVWMRAVDKSALMLPIAAKLVASRGFLCLFGTSELPGLPNIGNWQWKTHPFPGENARVLHIGQRI